MYVTALNNLMIWMGDISMLIKYIYTKYLVYRANAYTLPDIYRKYYGINIGEGCVFTGKNISFGSEPYLIQIGNKVRITADVKFETHDGGVGIFRDEYPGINIYGQIKVGDNSFIGHGSIIMPGVTIGSNVVIGAGSIVTKSIPSNSLAVGIPARVIKSIAEYKASSLKKAVFIKNTDPKLRKKEIQSHFV
jgi:acetyltransferase-like isoleucine patch superfamily enzyme